MDTSSLDHSRVLKYLGLPTNYEPSPDKETIAFLRLHIQQLPPELLVHFEPITNPIQRTTIPLVRNRRLKYVQSNPQELSLGNAQKFWRTGWLGTEDFGNRDTERKDEKEWADRRFLDGSTKHVGKLGNLLANFEDEREGERVRMLRRERAAAAAFIPEEDSDSDSDQSFTIEPEQEQRIIAEDLDGPNRQQLLQRRIHENFIYGLLQVSRNDATGFPVLKLLSRM